MLKLVDKNIIKIVIITLFNMIYKARERTKYMN